MKSLASVIGTNNSQNLGRFMKIYFQDKNSMNHENLEL